MEQSDFVHLHCHSGYSLLDSMVRIDSLVERVKEMGQDACAITDHGTLAGTVKFTDACLKRGIKPILGQEFYIAPDTRKRYKYPVDPKTKKVAHSASHLIVLAQTAKGWENLKKLSTIAYTEGFYRKPRIDHEVLERYSEGLIVSTACMGGDISVHLRKVGEDGEIGKVEFNEELAIAKMNWYAKVFGGNFFIELQEHYNDAQTFLNNWYRERYPQEMIYASADCHYLLESDCDTHDTLIASATVSHKNDPERWRFPTDQCWLKSTEEMSELFYESEITTTKRISDSVDFVLPLRKQFFMPVLPEDILQNEDGSTFTPEERFREQCEIGLQNRMGVPNINVDEIDYAWLGKYADRLEYEMSVFIKAGFVEYALILWDLNRWCKENAIFTGDGRGSGAGSLVLYALGITGIDPIERNCPFERFINPGRLENFAPPDVDLDFPQSRRQFVLAYLRERYGEDRVCQIGTYATLSAAALIKKLSPVLGIPVNVVNQLATTIPQGDSFQGKGPAGEAKGMSLDDIWMQSDKFRKLVTSLGVGEGQTGNMLMHYARGLRELGSHASTHASGVIITDRSVVDVVPLMVAKVRTADELVLAQMDMFDVELLGLIKFDILGLKTLDVLADVQKMIRERDDADFSFETINLDDPKAYNLLCKGFTVGVFQAEGEGFGRLLPQMMPTTVEDLAVLTSLCRPGPSLAGLTATYIRRRQGEENVTYDIPELAPVLGANLGVLAFQEDIMNIAHLLAGFTLAEADELRKVMGKKQKDKMPKYEAMFLAGMKKTTGIDEDRSKKLWDQILPMAEYVFNRSHAMAYSYTTAKCAWAKAHYPAYFMAASMSAEVSSGPGSMIPRFVREAHKFECTILPPDINESGYAYTALDHSTILVGLSCVRHVGGVSTDFILEERDRNGPFVSPENFRARVSGPKASKSVFSALMEAGAFRNIGGPDIGTDEERLHREFDLFGFYLSGHPCALNRTTWIEENPLLKTLAEIEADDTKKKISIRTEFGRKAIWVYPDYSTRVYVSKLDKKKSKRTGEFMFFVEIEDETTSLKMILNEKTLNKMGNPTIAKGDLLDLVARRDDPVKNPGYIRPVALSVIV